MSEIPKIHVRKIVKVNRAFGDVEEWKVKERAKDGLWVSVGGNVYSAKQLSILILELKKLEKYISGRKRK